jgi:inhibitor of KinA
MTRLPEDMQLEVLAEDAWILRFGDTIDATVNARVHAAAALLQAHLPEIECVPAYASLLLRFDPARWLDDDAASTGDRLRKAIDATWRNVPSATTAPREVVLPVWYGGEAGADLHDVAAHAQMTVEEVVARHTAASYRVAMLGFSPGFPYLLGLDPTLAMPRRSHPRLNVPAGSVAIGGLQTGIYPQTLPGGWQLIGRTPMRLFDLTAASPSLLQPGDRVRFRAIDEHDYLQLAVDAGTPP